MSSPMRGRGLKPLGSGLRDRESKSHLMQVRGLKRNFEQVLRPFVEGVFLFLMLF